MFAHFRSRLTYANVMATLAFFLALTGGAYAVAKLPKNSVGPKQLRRAAVTNVKVKKGTLDADRFSSKAITSLNGKQGPKGDAGAAGAPGLVRAFGHMLQSGALDISRANRGIVSGRSTGSYFCVKLDPSIDAATASPIVSLDALDGYSFSGSGRIGWAEPYIQNPNCNQGNEFGVTTGTYGATHNGGIPVPTNYPYFVAIP